MTITIQSVPAIFSSIPVGFPPVAALTPLTFAIPAGSYTQAFLQIDGNYTGFHPGPGTEDFFWFYRPGQVTFLAFQYSVGATDSLETAFINAPGDLQSPGWQVAIIGSDPTGWIPAIDAAAGGNLSIVAGNLNEPVNYTRCTLILTPASTGGTATAYTFEETVGPCNGGCNALTVQMLDADGNAATPASTQVFTLTCPSNGVSFKTSTLTITNPATTGMSLFCGLNSGTYLVTITPGAGPLSAVAAQTIEVTVCGSVTDPYLVQGISGSIGAGSSSASGTCRVTRLTLRDAVTIKLFGWCPFGKNQGAQGDLPTGKGFDWADMNLWNQAISETISDVNVRSKFHTTVNLSVPVGATLQVGPQFIPLQGIQGCPTEQSINTVRRVVWYDNNGGGLASTPPLIPISFQEEDRLSETYDNYQVGTPNMFGIVGYSIFLLPGSANGGYLSMYAGTAITQFVGDTDYIDQLPNDYLPTIVLGAAMRVAQSNLDKQNMAVLYPELKRDYYEALGLTNAWIGEQNEGHQPSFGVVSGRWPGRHMPVITKRRGSW